MPAPLRILLAMVLSIVLLAGCSKKGTSPMGGTMGSLRVRMTDAPGDFQAVNLVVTGVSAHVADGVSDSLSGWEVLSADSASYDLLLLRNGVFATLGVAQVPAGHYTQIRLKLGPGSTVMVDGTAYPLTVPSGMQSGLKLVGSFDVPANGTLDVGLDFDAARSIIRTGAGTYLLKPTVRAMAMTVAGAISGSISPSGTAATVFALSAGDTLGSTVPAADGTFKIDVLPTGTYAVAFHPAPGFRDTTITGVIVHAGATTDVPQVVLTPQ